MSQATPLLVGLVGLSCSAIFVRLYLALTRRLRLAHRMTCREQVRGLFVVVPISNVLYIIPWAVVYRHWWFQLVVLLGLASVDGFAVVWAWKRHRDHEVDCKYGPRDDRRRKVVDLLARLKPGWRPAPRPVMW